MTNELVTELLKTRSAYRLAKDLGLHIGTVYNWKHGKSQPSYMAIEKLTRLLEKVKQEVKP